MTSLLPRTWHKEGVAGSRGKELRALGGERQGLGPRRQVIGTRSKCASSSCLGAITLLRAHVSWGSSGLDRVGTEELQPNARL